MLLDKEALLSDAQAITATANSTNTYDARAAAADIGRGELLVADFIVTETFASGGSTTLAVSLETDDNTGFSSATVLAALAAIAKATLVLGYRFMIPIPPGGERYYRAAYTVASGPFTAGKITCQIGPRQQSDIDKFFPRAAVPRV